MDPPVAICTVVAYSVCLCSIQWVIWGEKVKEEEQKRKEVDTVEEEEKRRRRTMTMKKVNQLLRQLYNFPFPEVLP